MAINLSSFIPDNDADTLDAVHAAKYNLKVAIG